MGRRVRCCRGIAVLILSTMASGGAFSPRAMSADPAEIDSLAALAAKEITKDRGRRVRGVVMPLKHATISSRLQATITRIGPDNGEKFPLNHVLVTFDCGTFKAELQRAQANAAAAKSNFEVKTKLVASGSVSKLQALLARAELRKARAEVEVNRNRVAQCLIRAPYAGRVVKRIANAHETVNFRDPLLEIVSEDDVEVRAFVPSAWLRNLHVGRRFKFTIDETGITVPARVIAIGAWIDNVSQLVEVRAIIENDSAKLIAGMSGSVFFEDEK